MPRTKKASQRKSVVLNAGSGPTVNGRFPKFFRTWRKIRVDIDPDAKPDLVSSIVDLSAIADGTVDAVWSSHCIEHLYAHEVMTALSEFRRVLRKTGFACIVIPDLQVIAQWIATDRLDEVIYESASGPVTAHDMIWGFGQALAMGKTSMAHRCGFTPTPFLNSLRAAGFEEILLRRQNTLELVAIALRQRSKRPGYLQHILAEVGF
jgi:SAM-dependent methyltransferase